MVKEETDCIRRHPNMRYSTRAVRELDVGDAILRRTLDDASPLQMLRQFYDNCGQVKDCLNKQFRAQFFRVMRSEGGSSGSRRETSRDDRSTRDRDDRRYRDERESRRDDRDRTKGDDRDKGRDRYDDRKRDRSYDDRRSDDKYSSRDRDRHAKDDRRSYR